MSPSVANIHYPARTTRLRPYQWFGLGFCCLLLLAESAGADEQASLLSMHWRQCLVKDGLLSNHINVLLADRENLYIGTPQGLNIYPLASRKMLAITKANGLPDNNVLSLCHEGNTLWVGTSQGLAGYRQNQVHACILNAERAAQQIMAMVESRGSIILGTPAGLFAFSPAQERLEAIPGAEGKNIRCVQKLIQGLLYSCQDGRVFLYDETTQSGSEIEMEFNSLKHATNGIVSAGDTVWFSTEGSGLVGYNFIKKEWVSLTRALTMDTFINAVTDDGQYLWFGSFVGLYCYQQASKKWWLLEDARFTSSPITSLAIADNTLWVGTENQGIVYAEKPWPSIRFELPKRFYDQEKAVLKGRLQGTAAAPQIRMTYSIPASPGVVLSDHTQVTATATECEAQIDFTAFNDNIYDFTVQIADQQGRKNFSRFSLGKQLSPLCFDFANTVFRPGTTYIRGNYQGNLVKKIIFYPGAILAKLFPLQRVFEAMLPLQESDKYVQAQIFDPFGKSQTYAYKVQVAPVPDIEMVPEATVFNPQQEAATFKVKCGSRLDLERCAFIITDAAGNTIYVSASQTQIPGRLSWNGRDQKGRLLPAGQLLYCQLQIKEKSGFEFRTAKQVLRTIPAVLPGVNRIRQIPISAVFYFESGQTAILPLERKKLQAVLQAIRSYADCALLIEGHADDRPIHRPDYGSNQKLSEVRAENVSRLLAAESHLAPDRLIPVGYGQTRPKASNATAYGRKQNRRVEIFILNRK